MSSTLEPIECGVCDKLSPIYTGHETNCAFCGESFNIESFNGIKYDTSKKEGIDSLQKAVGDIRFIATALEPFLPETSEKIIKQFNGSKIKSAKPLFPRI